MPEKPSRIAWLDYLRGFITILVVAHHSSLAYTTFASFNKQAYILSTHPVVDPVRSKALDIFEDFNDVFFMSLMFLVSGIFVLPALARKQPGAFARDRFRRLFIPFAIAVTFLMPLAYYPAWLLAKNNPDPLAFLADFFTVEAWPAGPPWFIWVLCAFNGLLALAYRLARPRLDKAAGNLSGLANRPGRLLLGWYAFTWVIYIPVMLLATPGRWTGIGPFDFQVSRILLYFGYFILGALIGGQGLEKGLLATTSSFQKKAMPWLAACILAYTLLKISESPLDNLLAQNQLTHLQARLLYRSLWVLSCTASSMAFLSLFPRLFRRSYKVWDSLSANAYGIYLLHYIFVIWIQFLLLQTVLPAPAKFLITFLLSLSLSWLVTARLRKVRVIGKYL
jgi:glucan biosynthesis protein C